MLLALEMSRVKDVDISIVRVVFDMLLVSEISDIEIVYV